MAIAGVAAMAARALARTCALEQAWENCVSGKVSTVHSLVLVVYNGPGERDCAPVNLPGGRVYARWCGHSIPIHPFPSASGFGLPSEKQ